MNDIFKINKTRFLKIANNTHVDSSNIVKFKKHEISNYSTTIVALVHSMNPILILYNLIQPKLINNNNFSS